MPLLPGAILLAGMAPPDPPLLSAADALAAPPVRAPPLPPPAPAPPPPPPAARTLLELKAAANRTASATRMEPRARTNRSYHSAECAALRRVPNGAAYRPGRARISRCKVWMVALARRQTGVAPKNWWQGTPGPSHNEDGGHHIGRCVAPWSGLLRLSTYGFATKGRSASPRFRCSWVQALKFVVVNVAGPRAQENSRSARLYQTQERLFRVRRLLSVQGVAFQEATARRWPLRTRLGSTRTADPCHRLPIKR